MINKKISKANKLIAKNTVYLYIKEAVILLITLFSSRILLQQLGIDDFGLYGLIGSILVLFSSLRNLFSSSIQRFINVEKGKENSSNVNKIFCLGVIIHLFLSGIFFVVVEIAGTLIIPKLNIPPENIVSAHWVLQFSILASVVTIMTVPYDALIIANEKFEALTVLSIIECLLKLLCVYLLTFSPTSKVVVYSALLLVVALLVRAANAIYCTHRFREEAHFHWVKDRNYLRTMAVFAGWQFFGNSALSLMHTGMNFIINAFGGVAVNAARTIAYQVLAAVQKLVNNISLSFQPQCMILYSRGEIERNNTLLLINAKIGITVCAILGCTVAVFAPSILKIWLDDVPEYTIPFVQSIFWYAMIRAAHAPMDTLFKAAGELKNYQILEIVGLILNIPVAYIMLYIGLPYYSIFIASAIIELTNLLAVLVLAKYQLEFNSIGYIRTILFRMILLIGVLTYGGIRLVNFANNSNSLVITICKIVIFTASTTIISTFFMFTYVEIKKIYSLFSISRHKSSIQ